MWKYAHGLEENLRFGSTEASPRTTGTTGLYLKEEFPLEMVLHNQTHLARHAPAPTVIRGVHVYPFPGGGSCLGGFMLGIREQVPDFSQRWFPIDTQTLQGRGGVRKADTVY